KRCESYSAPLTLCTEPRWVMSGLQQPFAATQPGPASGGPVISGLASANFKRGTTEFKWAGFSGPGLGAPVRSRRCARGVGILGASFKGKFNKERSPPVRLDHGVGSRLRCKRSQALYQVGVGKAVDDLRSG